MAILRSQGNMTDGELGLAVFEKLYDLFRTMASLLDGEISETDEISLRYSFPTNPMFEGVWRAKLTPDDADHIIDETIGWFKERDAPYFIWWTGPETTPGDLPQRLQEHGLIDMAEQQ